MRRFRLVVCLGLAFFLLCAYGCATSPKTLPPEFVNHVDKLAIWIPPRGTDFQIIDHTGVREYAGGGTQFGLFGMLLESAIYASIADYRIDDSVGGDVDLLRKETVNLPMEGIIFKKLENRFSKKHEIINAGAIEIEGYSREHSGQASMNAVLINCKDAGADALIKIDFTYGLAAYSGEDASAAIEAEMAVWDLNTNKSIVKKHMVSDLLFKRGHALSEFVDNEAKLYKEDIEQAADSLALQTAAMFGIDVAEKDSKIIPDALSRIKADCKSPYTLSQDCSNMIGAKRLIEIDGELMKVSGSSDGKVILIMDDRYVDFADFKCAKIAASFLSKHDIHVLKRTKMTSSFGFGGILFELDKDGYTIFKEHSTERKGPINNGAH